MPYYEGKYKLYPFMKRGLFLVPKGLGDVEQEVDIFGYEKEWYIRGFRKSGMNPEPYPILIHKARLVRWIKIKKKKFKIDL